MNAWATIITDLINDAVSDRSISKEQLAEGLEDIADHAQSWAEQMREELKDE
jgi:hypothetical protein